MFKRRQNNFEGRRVLYVVPDREIATVVGVGYANLHNPWIIRDAHKDLIKDNRSYANDVLAKIRKDGVDPKNLLIYQVREVHPLEDDLIFNLGTTPENQELSGLLIAPLERKGARVIRVDNTQLSDDPQLRGEAVASRIGETLEVGKVGMLVIGARVQIPIEVEEAVEIRSLVDLFEKRFQNRPEGAPIRPERR